MNGAIPYDLRSIIARAIDAGMCRMPDSVARLVDQQPDPHVAIDRVMHIVARLEKPGPSWVSLADLDEFYEYCRYLEGSKPKLMVLWGTWGITTEQNASGMRMMPSGPDWRGAPTYSVTEAVWQVYCQVLRQRKLVP